MITGYYGIEGSMTEGWATEEEAKREMDEWYSDEGYSDCYVTEIQSGEWVIAY